MRKFILGLFATLFVLLSCTEDIDTSARYVFKEQTILDYLQKHDVYSEYVKLLQKVPVSSRSKSSVYQLLSARGHYTCFAPTNEAIVLYLQDQVEEGFLTEPTWESFKSEKVRDSIMRVIVYNSIIDGGDEPDAFFYTSAFPKDKDDFILACLNDKKLSVRKPANQPDSIYLNNDIPVSVTERDILVINGIIHQVGKVNAPKDITAASFIQQWLDEKKDVHDAD